MFSLPYYYPGRKKKVLKEDGDTAIAHVYAVLHQMLFYFLLLLRCCSGFLCSAVFISLFRLDLYNLAVFAVAGLSGDLLISSDLEVISLPLFLSALDSDLHSLTGFHRSHGLETFGFLSGTIDFISFCLRILFPGNRDLLTFACLCFDTGN